MEKTATDFPKLAGHFAEAVGSIERVVSSLLADVMHQAAALLTSPENYQPLILKEIDVRQFVCPLLDFARNAEAHVNGSGFAVLREIFLSENKAFHIEPLAYLKNEARAQLAELVEMADGLLDGFLDIAETRLSANLLAEPAAPTVEAEKI